MPKVLRTLPERGFRRRARAVAVLFCAVCLGLAVRLFFLQVRTDGFYADRAQGQQLRDTVVPADRGRIYSADGLLLAANSSCWTLRASPREMPEEKITLAAHGLAEILALDEAALLEKFSDRRSNDCLLRYRVDRAAADAVRDFCEENSITGIRINQDSKRWYPQGAFLASVLGFTNVDNAGVAGLELKYDDLLTGENGVVLTAVNAWGYTLEQSYETECFPTEGDGLRLTIDSCIQHYLENALSYAVQEHHVAARAVGIVMDVNTGAILAMATLGSYDPNNYLEIADEGTAAQLEEMKRSYLSEPEGSEAYEAGKTAYGEALSAARLKQWRNRVISDGYEPGSTFKLVTLAAALDCGAVTENSTFYCGGHETFNDREQEVSCWKAAGHGMQTTMEALGHSCNIAFGHIGVNMTRKTFVEYFKAFGFLEKTGVDLPGEASGLFWDENDFSVANLISASFGQTFRVTPMEQVRAIAAIVNGGYLLKPYVVSQVLDSDGSVVKTNERTVLRQVISEETSKTMRKMMEYVVTDGTAGSAKTPGYRVGGKTGTSEKIDVFDENGNPVEDKIVSFIGVAPIDDPKYVVLVALDTPNYVAGTSYTPHNQYISGGLMAAPTVRDVFLDILPYLGVEPDYSSDDIRGVNITLPDVIGMTQDEAAKALSDKSITYRTVGAGDTVTDQLPSPGAEVPGNSEIILYFGNAVKTTEQVEVPNFVGYGIADVDYLATNAGLYIQAKGTDHRDEYVTVAYQDIEPGTMVDRGTTITVEFTTGGASD